MVGRCSFRVLRRERALTRSWTKNGALHTHCVGQVMKLGHCQLMVWGCFSALVTGSFVRVKGIMDKNVYQKILIRNAKPTLSQQSLSVFQHDKDSKHTAKTIKTVYSRENMASYCTGLACAVTRPKFYQKSLFNIGQRGAEKIQTHF